MHITRIRLHDFRSYERLVLAPAPGLCVLLGENAAGKTNVLEAVFLCALGRSHRTRHDGELVRSGQEAGMVELDLVKRTGPHNIACRLFSAARRELTVDGRPLSRSGELLGTLHVVMFSPEDLRLIKQGPAERRRFLDMELSQLQPAYYYRLQQYNLALRQRNALLKRETDPALFAPWDEQLSVLGASLINGRAGFMQRLSALASELHASLSGGEKLRAVYQPAFEPAQPAIVAEAMRRALAASLERDIRLGSTQTGPHRDDILLELNGADVRAYGSQGQQRTAALALKLSELTLMEELGGEPPVLLLDDVLSELDCTRQRMLAEAMGHVQTFLTCTQLAGLNDAGISDMTVYRVENGGAARIGA